MGMRELIEKGNVTKHGRQFVAKVLQLQADITQAVAMGATPQYRVTLEGAGRRAILRDLMADRAADRARIQAEIEAEKARYESNYFKDLSRHDFEIRQAEKSLETKQFRSIGEALEFWEATTAGAVPKNSISAAALARLEQDPVSSQAIIAEQIVRLVAVKPA